MHTGRRARSIAVLRRTAGHLQEPGGHRTAASTAARYLSTELPADSELTLARWAEVKIA